MNTFAVTSDQRNQIENTLPIRLMEVRVKTGPRAGEAGERRAPVHVLEGRLPRPSSPTAM